MLRIQLKKSILDITGFCLVKKRKEVVVQIQTGLNANETRELNIENIQKVTEIMSSPLFYRLRRMISGSQAGIEDLKWENDDGLQEEEKDDILPRMLLRCPEEEKYPRV